MWPWRPGGDRAKAKRVLAAHMINAGLATVTVETLASPRIEIARVTITPAGREAIG